MIADWLAREGGIIFTWWLLATLAGVGALPLVMHVLRALPDRGVILARAAGVLLIGVVYWLLVTLGFTRNEPGGIVLAWSIVLALGIAAQVRARERVDWRVWWREHRAGILTAELLFAVLFVAWALVRAHQNNVVTTEKPMDLALLASVQRTLTFPPPDPWLSGYAISYYYLGYVFGAMFGLVSGTAATVTYNLWTAMLFALGGLTVFGVVYNMVHSRKRDSLVSARRMTVSAIVAGLLGVYLLSIMGNYLTPLVDVPYFNRSASPAYLQFWDVRERQEPSISTEPAPPERWGYWWWFRSARVIQDRNLTGSPSENTEVINEFPMFSYVLADNHPHVMALPFLVLAFGMAVNVALSTRRPSTTQLIFYGVSAGALVFLNTWDAPVAIACLVAAEGLRRLRLNGALTWGDGTYLLAMGAALGGLMLVTYFPFLVGFQSQLGGVLPNVIHPTRFAQYLLVFGALVPLAMIFIGIETWRARRDGRLNLSLGLKVGLAAFGVVLAVMLVLLLAGALMPETRIYAQEAVDQAGGWGVALPEILIKRLTHGVTTLVLLAGVVLLIARLMPRRARDERRSAALVTYPAAGGMALIFLGAALAVTLIPEYVYLRDNFNTRMNTIFKFYYQAWALYAVAGAYGVYSVLDDPRLRLPALPVRIALGVVIVIALGLGAAFPLYAIPERALYETALNTRPDAVLTLDGGRTLTNTSDYEALVCLRDVIGRDDVVVAELVKEGSYDYFAGGIGSGRLAGLTGAPTVIGWTGHQSQWRGRDYFAAVGTRPADIARLYQDLRIDMVQDVITTYGIDYIVFGQAERERYGATGEEKFLAYYDVVCQSGDSRVFRVRPLNLTTTGGNG